MSHSAKQSFKLTPKRRALLDALLKEKGVESSVSPMENRRAKSDTAPLSYAQMRLWFLDQLQPNNSFYNMPGLLRINGALNVTALDQSLKEIARRHESLRTTFVVENGQSFQKIEPDISLQMDILDVTGVATSRPEVQSNQVVVATKGRPFNLEQGPMIRVQLLHCGHKQYQLLIVMHHIISDGWSLGVFIRELMSLYEAYCDGRPSSLAEITVQYGDYSIWQREHLRTEAVSYSLQYWKEQLADAPPLLALPTDFQRPPVQTHRGRNVSLELSEELSGKLKRLSRIRGTTLFMTMLAVLKILLQRYAGQSDIIVGAPVAGRNRTETQNLIGFFLNFLVLRTDLTGEPTFLELLDRVKEVSQGAYAHQEVPFELLLTLLQPERSLSYAPLCQVIFNLLNFEDSQIALKGLEVKPEAIETDGSAFDLTIYAYEKDNGIAIAATYNIDLFKEKTISTLLSHYRNLLESVVASPEARISMLPMLLDQERVELTDRRDLAHHVNTSNSFEGDAEETINERFEYQVNANPQAIAVKTRKYEWTYRELNNAGNHIANRILGEDLEFGCRVALLSGHDAPAIAAIIGALKAGTPYVPLDPSYPVDRLVYMLEDSRASAIITDSLNIVVANDLAKRLPQLVSVININDLDYGQSMANPDQNISSEAIAYILYTSGSTGQPKGVAQNHRNVLSHIRNYTNSLRINAHDRLSLFSTYSFDAAVMDIFGALLNGAALYPFQIRNEGIANAAPWLTEQSITIYHSTPTVYRYWIRTLTDEQFPSLRIVVLGGEEVFKQDVDAYKKHFSADCIFINGLGPTESTLALQYFVNRETQIFTDQVPVGYQVGGTEVLLLSDSGEKIPDIGIGEIAIRSGHLALGYWGKPELTRAAFLSDNDDVNKRIYRTGDLGRLQLDGAIRFVDRKDFQVKIRGHRVELAEIEASLHAHGSIDEAVVIAAQDGADKRLIAYVVPRPNADFNVGKLLRFLREKLPDHMIPSAFVMLTEMPLTPNGKVDRRALPAPDQTRPDLENSFVPPRTTSEKKLAEIWLEVLKIEKVGVFDNFFELGGHSLLVTQVISRVCRDFRIEIPIKVLFEAPTIADLAKVVDQSKAQTEDLIGLPLKPGLRPNEIPLSYAQQRLWFLNQLDQDSPAYNLPYPIRIRTRLNLIALEQAINEVVRRHEILRTNFPSMGGSPIQRIVSDLSIDPICVDLTELRESQREAVISKLAREEAKRPFDLSNGSLLRVHQFQLSQADQIVMTTMHHIISDGWSNRLLMQEVTLLQTAFNQGNPSSLPDLEIQYADFAIWQRTWLQGTALEEQLSFWRKTFTDAPPSLDLFADYPRPAVQTFRGASHSLLLTKEISNSLQSLSRRQGTTLFMTMLSAFKLLLYRATGQNDIVIGSPIANRNRVEIEGLIGFFVNTLPLRTDLSGNPTFKELLSRVREVSLGAFAHQDLPFEKLVEELKLERTLSHTPVFQVMFNLTNLREESTELANSAEVLSDPEISSMFDMTLYVNEIGEEIELRLVYNKDLFEPARISLLTEQLNFILSQAVTNPNLRIDDFSLITPDCRMRLPDPTTALDCSWNGLAHQKFTEQARIAPNSEAIRDVYSTWTYEELDKRSNQLANYLRANDVVSQDLIAIYGHRSASLVWAVISIMKAGAAFVILDPAYPVSRLAVCLNKTRPTGWLQIQAAGEPPHELLSALSSDSVRITIPDRANHKLPGFLENCSSDPPGIEIGPDNLAYIMFTSGSTGEPKGVVGEHRPIYHFIDWYTENFGLHDQDRFCMLSGLAHDPLLRDIFGPLSVGATLCIPGPESIESPGSLAEWMRNQRITIAHLTPATARLLTTGNASRNSDTFDPLHSLRYVFYGADVLAKRDIDELRELAPEATCVNFYGATETPQAMGYFVIPGQSAITKVEQRRFEKSVPIGKGIRNVQLLVLSDSLRLAGTGEVGEIYVRTPYLSRGYLEDEFLTASKFIVNPFTKTDRLYRTGDIGRYLPDGNVEFLGRRDNQVKIRGFRIELGEIQNELHRYEELRDNIVLVKEDARGDKRLVAYLVCHQQIEVGELRRRLMQKLPDYMIPSAFVMIDSLPVTHNGKIDYKALPQPENSFSSQNYEYVPPGNPIEEVISEIWCGVLGINQVGIYDNFFEIGGHSLLATQVMSRVRDALDVELPLRRLFEAPTVAELARRVREAKSSGVKLQTMPIKPVSRQNGLPLSFAQQRAWFVQQLNPDSTGFILSGAVQMLGSLNRVALEQCLGEVVRRHESLRTVFVPAENGEPTQVIGDEAKLQIRITDLQLLKEEVRERESTTIATDEAGRVFDLAAGPLLRVNLLSPGENEHILLVSMHHIIADGWSLGVLLKEIRTLYEVYTKGEPSTLADLEIQYADFACWQREWLKGDVLQEQLSYWRAQLGGCSTMLKLPTDRPRPAVQTFNAATESFELSKKVTDKLRFFGRQEGATLYMVLLAAVKVLLNRYTGQEDLNIGTYIANRNRSEIEGLIGFLVNTVVLRTQFNDRDDFIQLLKQVRDVTLAAYAHQELPFERILEDLQPERNQSHTPLFQVLFALQNVPRPSAEFSGLTLRQVDVAKERRSNFDLTFWLWEVDGGLTCILEYNKDLFNPETIARMAKHFQILLEAAIANPAQRISDLPMLTEEEQTLLAASPKHAMVSYANPLFVHREFELQAEKQPDSIAVLFEDAHLTYSELNRRANQLAHHLRKSGVGPEVLVGICVERSIDMIVGLLGIMKTGGAYIPLDPDYPNERLSYIVADAAISVLVTHSEMIEKFPAIDRVVCLDTELPEISQNSVLCPDVNVNLDNLAYVIYTSGSTGNPKGVMISHRSLMNYTIAASDTYTIGSEDRVLQFASINFDASAEEIYPCLTRGAMLVLRSDSSLDSVQIFFEYCRDNSITILNLPTAYWHELAAQAKREQSSWSSSIRLTIIGGEKALADRAVDWQLLMKPDSRLVNTYGPTEATIVSTKYELPVPIQPNHIFDGVPIGRAVSGANTYVLSRALQPVPISIPGELCIGGAGVARGYLNRSELTAEKLIPNAFGVDFGERLYRSGDLVRYDHDGNLDFVGRVDYQAKIRGYRIEPGEVEAFICQHPNVQQAAVLAREDFPGNNRLVAYVVWDSDQAQTLKDQEVAGNTNEFVTRWQKIYDEGVYNEPSKMDPQFNTAGWNSSHTGLPIPAEEMREWVDSTVQRIMRLKPRRVLEIGCGTGLLLFRIAPETEFYYGTDFSSVALESLRNQVEASGQNWNQVKLSHQTADNFSGIDIHRFDTVIINSVVQYFPSVDYLIRVLHGVVKILEPGGHIFLGDVRSLPLLEAFHTSVELQRAPGNLTVDKFEHRAQKRLAQEQELVISPDFFRVIDGLIPEIRQKQISLKGGSYCNELTKFRYDVTLRIDSNGARDEGERNKDIYRIDWAEHNLNLTKLADLLKESQAIAVTGIPNGRVLDEVKTVELTTVTSRPRIVSELRETVRASAGIGIDPEELSALGRQLGYKLNLDFSETKGIESFDAFFERPDETTSEATGDLVSFGHSRVLMPGPWHRYANNPLKGISFNTHIAHLRQFLEDRLPAYMLPSSFVFLDAMPLTPNGKIDRQKLPAPSQNRPEMANVYVAPGNETEQLIAEMYGKILGFQLVGANDSFFELGGHSLLATQIVSRVRDTFKVELPLRRLFESPSVAELARCVEEVKRSGTKFQTMSIKPVSHQRPLPLSFAQQRLWFLQQLDPESAAYNLHIAACAEGSLNEMALEQCLIEVIRRHKSLRTIFVAEAGEPVQVITEKTELKPGIIDLQKLKEEKRESKARALAANEAGRSFDLSTGPLLRVSLIRLGDKEHILLSLHHIISDAWSMGILVEEIRTLYEAYAKGEPSTLVDLEIQYADFACWQREWLESNVLEKQLNYWMRQLENAPRMLNIPTDFPRGAIQTYTGDTREFVLHGALTRELKTLSQQEESTLFMTLLSAFLILLYRYSNQDDIVVGADIANRNQAETEKIVGFFVNMLVLRTNISGDPTVREFIRRVREVTLDGYANQDLPFERLVQLLQPERNLSHNPLFQVVFNFFSQPSDTPLSGQILPGLTMTPLERENVPVRFDLSLFIIEEGEALKGVWRYRTDLFKRGRIERMQGHLETLLQSIVANPNCRLSELRMLTEEETRKSVTEKAEIKKSNFERFKNAESGARVAVSKEMVKAKRLSDDDDLLLIIQPNIKELDLTTWATANSKLVEEKLLAHGAILFRGFDLNSVAQFNQFAKLIGGDLLDYTEPSSPRTEVDNKIYTSTNYPADQRIEMHNEMSYSRKWPNKVFFFCLTPPEQGGETPIAYSKKVLSTISPEIRERFARKNVIYARNYVGGLGLAWQHVFQTDDKRVVEKFCRDEEIDFEWRNGECLYTRKIRPAITRHPKTGELLWFNQAHAFHASTLPLPVREVLLADLKEENMPRNAYYGDGSPIEDSDIQQIREAYRQASVSFKWQQGDILLLDNMMVAHGRAPYAGDRRILVAMSGLISDREAWAE